MILLLIATYLAILVVLLFLFTSSDHKKDEEKDEGKIKLPFDVDSIIDSLEKSMFDEIHHYKKDENEKEIIH